MVECAESLGQYLAKTPGDGGARKGGLQSGVRTLGKLKAVDSLQELLLSRPDAPVKRILKHIVQADPKQASDALIAISESALSGAWQPTIESRRTFLNAMASFFATGRQRGEVESWNERSLQGRRELARWVGREGGAEALRGLTWVPLLEEKKYFIQGLSFTERETVLACIQALEHLQAKDAIPDLVRVFDREDAMRSLHPKYHAMTEEQKNKLSVLRPPVERDNLAYTVDRVLTELAGGDGRRVPPYKDAGVLKERRRYWQKWIKTEYRLERVE